MIRPIGKGGFGEVWLAANQTTGALRAIKLIPLERPGGADPAGREITSLARLEAGLRRPHPNLLAIHHVGKTGGHLFYIMDLADDSSGAQPSDDASYRAATLDTRLEGGPLPPRICADYARQLLAGLAALHEAGMIHRDVKPANCLFVGGELKLADFGLLTEARPLVSRVGTERYMPPDGRMGPRADVYAAGLVIYELVSGLPADRFPELGERAVEVARDPGLSALMRVSLKACQPDPAERFSDAGAMLAALIDPLAGRQGMSRRKLFRAAAAALAAIGVLVAIGILLAGGALSFLLPPPRVHVNFTTVPYEASVFIDGVEQRAPDGSPYRTPCTIENLPARSHRVMFRSEGLPDLPAVEIDFAATREVIARWKERP